MVIEEGVLSESDFKDTFSDKLIAFCEPLPAYNLDSDNFSTRMSMTFHMKVMPLLRSNLVKMFQETSVLKDIKSVNLPRICQQESATWQD